MKTLIWKNLTKQQQAATLKRPALSSSSSLLAETQKIIADVRINGDSALMRYTELYDKVKITNFSVTEKEFTAAAKSVTPEAKNAFDTAVKRIEKFHKAQYPKNIRVQTSAGIICEKQSRPIQRVGLYIPGGTAPLPSTVLMLGIPAMIAKCPLRVLCTPPKIDGTIDANILYAAKLCKIDQVYKIGGAQAIAAMAYGTKSIPKVDKIFGPGNSWVTQAKILASLDPDGAAYDLPAGPSEVMVIADKSSDPAYIASDLLSQAEHGIDSQVMLITDNSYLAEHVQFEIKMQLEKLSRKEIAAKSLDNSYTIIVDDIASAIEIANRYAPEHLILQIKSARKCCDKITAAGSVFIGKWSPESVGDYASGTNHVLPTYGYGRAHSGLSVSDFMNQITFQELTKEGLEKISNCVETLADIEGLDAHKRAVTIRLGGKKK